MEILKQILQVKSDRMKLINEFQNSVWNSDDPNEILSELAYDLDYYEQDLQIRATSPEFYGDEEMVRLIREALAKLGHDI